MGPSRAAQIFLKRHMDVHRFRVTLFSSLAATGKGHLTDEAIAEVFASRSVEICFRAGEELPQHPNGMRFEALTSEGDCIESWEVYSTGGGAIAGRGLDQDDKMIYPLASMSEILSSLEGSGETFWHYVRRFEDDSLWTYLEDVKNAMDSAIRRGIESEGVLPGELKLRRKAALLFKHARMHNVKAEGDGRLAAYAYAVAEENAAKGVVVTAPTCGACGVLPAVLMFFRDFYEITNEGVLQALATAGIFGNFVKSRGSISGAEVGCQGEIGTACAMGAAAATQLSGGSVRQIEYAAEMALEHHLGLTCDPVLGLVQIPCIERNAHAAMRAMNCSRLALLSDGFHTISFDDIITVMKETGKALPKPYRETSMGGLARIYRKNGEVVD